jgi:hypothetical protein
MYCNHCRALNPDDAIYCSSCGRTIQPPIEEEKEQRETKRLETALQNLNILPATEPRPEESSSWDYQKMSDEELEQLQASHQKLQQPINDVLRRELELRASKRLGGVTTPPPPFAQVVSTNQTDSTGISPVTAVEAPAKQKVAPAPYARFVVQMLASCFFASVGVFGFFEAIARNTTAFTILAFSVLFTFAVGWSARRTWQRILISEPETELKAKHRHQNILVASAVLVLLYLGLGALLGSVIGQYRAESIQFNVDNGHEKELADRISKDRNSVEANIPSYLRMYKAIEPEVREYSATLLRLRTEVGIYDSKFPDQHVGTGKYKAFIETEIRRSELLTKQIAIAKQIEPIAESQQRQLWQLDMLPLLKEEDGLDQSK